MKTNEFDKPREIPVKPQTTLTPKEIDDRVEKAKEKLHKKPEPFDFSKLWSKDEPRYEEFLQNKLDQAMQEYDSPEKKAQRDALMKQYLAKGGKVQKVPAGQTAYKGKELKPAFKKDNGTPITSPGSDESVERKPSDKQVRQAKGIAFDKRYKGGNYTGAHNTIEKLKKGLTKHPDVADALKRANEEMNRIIDEAYKRHKTNEEAPFDGMSLVRMALMRKFITAEEWYHLKDKWKAATQELEQRYDDWPEDQGFGSSDHAYAIKELMELVGYEFDDQDRSGRFVVSKMPPELEKAGIKNARMQGEPVEEAPIEQDRDNPIAKPYVDTPEWKALHDMDDKIIQAYIKHKEVAEADGLQPADLKRLGQNEPKVYVHKDGKTIMVPRKQAHNYIAKGWKKSALRAETSYESKLADMLNQRLK
jgi:hypothetical protein